MFWGLSVLTEAVLAFFGLRVISSAPSGDGGIYFLFGAFLAVVAILAMTLYVSVVGIPAF